MRKKCILTIAWFGPGVCVCVKISLLNRTCSVQNEYGKGWTWNFNHESNQEFLAQSLVAVKYSQRMFPSFRSSMILTGGLCPGKTGLMKCPRNTQSIDLDGGKCPTVLSRTISTLGEYHLVSRKPSSDTPLPPQGPLTSTLRSSTQTVLFSSASSVNFNNLPSFSPSSIPHNSGH